jgi:hypothetical protein
MAKYGVYIIEFLRAEDFCDGEALNSILEASGIPTKYKWAETIEDFKTLLVDFKKTDYRYLHISCHADEMGFELNGEEVSNEKIQKFTKKLF